MLVRQKDGNMYMMILNDRLSPTYRNMDYITPKYAQDIRAICQYVSLFFWKSRIRCTIIGSPAIRYSPVRTGLTLLSGLFKFCHSI